MRFSFRQSPVIVILATLVLTAAARQIPAAQAAPTAAELTKKLQARYQTVRDFTADFTQTYQGVLQRKAAHREGQAPAQEAQPRADDL
jgi:outer membrane lipoprotein-sorting protein